MKEIIKLKGSVALAEETSKIVEVASRVGIVLPSTHTALFKSVYAKIEEPNGNGVRLSKDAVESSLPGLVGSQVNLEHLGKGFLVGIILDAWLNASQEIEVVFTFAKNIYKEEYVMALERMQEGKLAVSFELMTERDSQERLDDGTVRLHDVDWQGMGFLIEAPPAYKKALVYDMAKLYKQRANDSLNELVYASKIVANCDDVMKAYMIDQDGLSMGVTSVAEKHFHVYKLNDTGNGGKTIATFGDDTDHVHEVKDGFVLEAEGHTHSFMDQVLANKHVVQEQKENNQGGINIMTEEQKALVAQLRAELEGYLPENISDDDLLVEAKVEEIRKAKTDKEDAMKRTQEVNQKSETTDDGKTTTNKETITVVEVIDWEAKAKEAEAKLVEASAKDAKITELEATIVTLTAENDGFKAEAKAREDAAKAEVLAKIKADLKDNQFAKDFKDEDFLNEAKVKEVKILKENADLKAENANLKKNTKKEVVAAETTQEVIPTGSGENNEENPRKLIAKMGQK